MQLIIAGVVIAVAALLFVIFRRRRRSGSCTPDYNAKLLKQLSEINIIDVRDPSGAIEKTVRDFNTFYDSIDNDRIHAIPRRIDSEMQHLVGLSDGAKKERVNFIYSSNEYLNTRLFLSLMANIHREYRHLNTTALENSGNKLQALLDDAYATGCKAETINQIKNKLSENTRNLEASKRFSSDLDAKMNVLEVTWLFESGNPEKRKLKELYSRYQQLLESIFDVIQSN